MSTDPNSLHGYVSPSMTLVLTVLLLIFFFIGFFSVFFCRCFIHTSPFYTRFNRQNQAPSPPEKSPSLGLDPKIINSFPTFTYSAVKDLRIEKFGLECAICICEFLDDDVLRLFTKCCHVFHQDCIDLWLENNKTCPVCRGNLEIVEQQPPLMCGINEDEPLEDSVYMPQNISAGSVSAVSIDIADAVEERERGERGKARVARTEMLDKYPRSHSTGHSIKKKDDLGVDRFTLRLPEHLHVKLLRGHNWTGSCTTFGEFTSRTKTGFGEISDVAGGDVNRV